MDLLETLNSELAIHVSGMMFGILLVFILSKREPYALTITFSMFMGIFSSLLFKIISYAFPAHIRFIITICLSISCLSMLSHKVVRDC